MANPLYQKHIISINDLSRDDLNLVLATAAKLKANPQPELLKNKVIASCFFEASTRTRRVPFIQSCASWPLMIMTVIVMIVGIALPFSPLASYLQLQALPLSYFPWLVAILAGYMTLTQLVKGFYSRRYGWQ